MLQMRYLLLLLFFQLVVCSQESPPLPSERLAWDLSAWEQDTGSEWLTAQFSTLPGALYTLQSSADLENWASLNSFYALGSELNLALFESVAAPVPLGGGPSVTPPEAMTSVSFMLRPSPSPLLEGIAPAEIEEMVKLDPRSAALRLDGLISKYALGNSEIHVRRALAAELLKNPEVEEYFRTLIRGTPRYYSKNVEVQWAYPLLANLRSGWAIRLLAEDLMDPTPMSDPDLTQEEIFQRFKWGDFFHANYPQQAAAALSCMDLPHSPAENFPRMMYTGNIEVEEWRTWWRTHGEEVLRAVGDEGPIPVFGEKGQRTGGKRTSHREPIPQPKKTGPTTPKPPSYRWWLGGAMLLVVIGFGQTARGRLRR